MWKSLRFTIGLTLMLGLGASWMPASAACSDERLITTVTYPYPTYLYSPGHPFRPDCDNPPWGSTLMCGGTMTYYATGFFWSFGGGNPAIGLGNDNGSNSGSSYSNWLHPRYFGTKALMGGPLSHWQAPGTDGCVSKDGSNATAPDPDECNVVVVNDLNGPDASFGVFATPPDASFDFAYTQWEGFPSPLELAPVPTPTIVQAVPLQPGYILLTVTVDPLMLVPANGFYLQCAPAQNAAILTGWKLYSREFPLFAAEPQTADSRALIPFGSFPPVPPWTPIGGKNAIGQSVQFIVDWDYNKDVVLCATLTFGGNEPGAADWELDFCSQSSPRVHVVDTCFACYDFDGDGYFAAYGDPTCNCDDDCLDSDPFTHPFAPEVNDGRDNQCGWGGENLIDEIASGAGFHYPQDKTRFSWLAQGGATLYEIARSDVRDFSATCTTLSTPWTDWSDPDIPLPGDAYHYLVRSLAPHPGSWGEDSSGGERTDICP